MHASSVRSLHFVGDSLLYTASEDEVAQWNLPLFCGAHPRPEPWPPPPVPRVSRGGRFNRGHDGRAASAHWAI